MLMRCANDSTMASPILNSASNAGGRHASNNSGNPVDLSMISAIRCSICSVLPVTVGAKYALISLAAFVALDVGFIALLSDPSSRAPECRPDRIVDVRIHERCRVRCGARDSVERMM